MANATKNEGGTATAVDTEKRGYWWIGALPAIGKVNLEVPQTEYNDETGGYTKMVKADAATIWVPVPNRRPRMWVGKIRQEMGTALQNITTHYADFPAWTDQMNLQDSGEAIGVPHPGTVRMWRDDEAKRVIDGCWEHFIEKGSPDRPSQPRWIHEARYDKPEPGNPHTYPVAGVRAPALDARKGDRWIAEFVYVVKVRDLSDDEPVADGNDLWRLFPMTMEQLLRQPPKSVFEMYPRK